MEQELGDDFGVEFDEFDEFGVRFVCVFCIWLMSLGVGYEQELPDEFDGDFDEFDEFGGCFCCVFDDFGVRLMSLGWLLMSLVVG